MQRTTMTRDRAEAERLVRDAQANVGRTSSWGRITETLLGATLEEIERTGRPLFIVKRLIHNHDPLVDGNLSREVVAARAAYMGRGA